MTTVAIGDALKQQSSSAVDAWRAGLMAAGLRLVAERDIDDERKEAW